MRFWSKSIGSSLRRGRTGRRLSITTLEPRRLLTGISADDPNLVLWLDAADSDTLVLDGPSGPASVSTWTDKKHGVVFDQAIANSFFGARAQPTPQTSTLGPNNLTAVDFFHSYLDTPDIPGVNNPLDIANAAHLFVVMNWRNPGGAASAFFNKGLGNNEATVNYIFSSDLNGGGAAVFSQANWTIGNGDSLPQNTPVLFEFVFDASLAGDNYKFFINGNPAGTRGDDTAWSPKEGYGALLGGQGAADTAGAGVFVNDAFFDPSFANAFDGQIGELVFFDQALSAEQQDEVREELTNKWLTMRDPLSPIVLATRFNADQVDPPNLPRGQQPTDWMTQRSQILSIDVEFTTDVSASAEDFQLTNLGVDAPTEPDTVVPLENTQVNVAGSRVRLTFERDELPPGVYQLEILATLIGISGKALDGNGDGTPGDSYVWRGSADNRFYVLPSEWNGDGGVSIFDFTTFSYWFGQGLPDAPLYVDLNNDAGVSIFDFPSFGANFGRGVTYPAPLALGPGAAASENRLLPRAFDREPDRRAGDLVRNPQAPPWAESRRRFRRSATVQSDLQFDQEHLRKFASADAEISEFFGGGSQEKNACAPRWNARGTHVLDALPCPLTRGREVAAREP